MKKDFHLTSSVEVTKDESSFDLHNCYGFSGLHLHSNKVMIGFIPDPIWGKGQPDVLITFSEVRYLEVNVDFSKTCLPGCLDFDEMGYKSPQDIDYDWLLSENQANFQDHLFFRFEADQYIRIYASQVNLIMAKMLVSTI